MRDEFHKRNKKEKNRVILHDLQINQEQERFDFDYTNEEKEIHLHRSRMLNNYYIIYSKISLG